MELRDDDLVCYLRSRSMAAELHRWQTVAPWVRLQRLGGVAACLVESTDHGTYRIGLLLAGGRRSQACEFDLASLPQLTPAALEAAVGHLARQCRLTA